MQTALAQPALARNAPAAASGRAARITGRILSGLCIAFLGMDAIVKVLLIEPVRAAAPQLGYQPETMVPIGIALLVCTLLYAAPRTAVLGAILLTGYLGGAVATHVRVLHPLVTHALFPLYLGAFVWGGLLLRDARLRAFLPWRSRN